ncbi:MAG: TIGR01212 family radical SAM protein, partial [Bacteroides sp.]|nr:TIGR01212 family radical SAM protein [Bacteroides sp.]
MSYPWGTERRLNTYSDYFKREFGSRVQKITIDAGFTCPNRDGACGSGGCTFCNNNAFTPSYNKADKSIREQIERGMEFHRTRYRKASQYLAYFQSYTNTYADLDRLKAIYQEALDIPGIAGIVVGTRPDSVDPEKLDFFKELSKKCYVTIEYGIESVYNHTLERVNRGHDVEKTVWAIRETAARGIRVGGHMIVGLPGESREDILRSVEVLSDWPLNNIKFHQLQLIHGTAMAGEYKQKPEEFPHFGIDEYLQL